MSIDTRWRLTAVAAALIVGTGIGLVGSAATAEEGGVQGTPPPEVPAGASEAVAERLDRLLENAASRLAAERSVGVRPSVEMAAVRAELEAARAQIEVLNTVVVEALVGQYQVEAELQAARQDGATQVNALEVERDQADARSLMLADQLEALTDQLALLQAEVDALRTGGDLGPRSAGPAADARSVAQVPTPEVEPSSSFQVVGTAEAAPIEGLLPEAGDIPPLVAEVNLAAVAERVEASSTQDDPIKVGQVHFDPGSAILTPGGERKTEEAAERIRSMDVEAVRIVGYADTVGDADANQHLSLRRADSIAAMLEGIGISRDKIEIVGRGEDGVPEPTDDHISEPLNRCAGIFVVTAYPK